MSKLSLLQWLISFFFISLIGIYYYQGNDSFLPIPTGGIQLEGSKQSLRKDWIERMHSTAPGTNWRQTEYQTKAIRLQKFAREDQGRSNCQTATSFLNGQLSGRWLERGSNNQAGSIFETAYDPGEDRIWLISAGGTLWSSLRTEINWRIENQNLQFDRGFLQLITLPNKMKRLIAFTGRIPHYSDDRGKTWQAASGLAPTGREADFHTPAWFGDRSCFVLSKPSYFGPFSVYYSKDYGSSFQKVTTLDTHEPDRFSLCQPTHTEELFLARKAPNDQLRIQQWDAIQKIFVDVSSETPLSLGQAPANLIGILDSLAQLRLYTYLEEEEEYYLYSSLDSGKVWEKVGLLPRAPWMAGLYASPSQPNVLYLGELEAFKSLDNGASWEKVNEWWEYYDNVGSALHADIMAFQEFETLAKEAFQLISHHGGISISYDQFETQQNISIVGLNTSQYYSIRTDPLDPNFVYAGSQDQGFQRAIAFEEEDGNQLEAFEQVISGDYGQIVFSREGTALWTVYPGGWINYYDAPQTNYLSASYELESENESVWLPPLMTDPRPDKNGILMAGGNLEGGPGSFLISLEYKDQALKMDQIQYDFKLESGGGEISALATSTADADFWYVSTTNGRFFYSQNQGENWEQSLNFIPEGHYLYGQAILPSKFDPSTVFLAGSGYDNPPVFLSKDGGASFQAMDEGLPPTLVFSLAANEEETLIFAATEAGPFVFNTFEERWYELSTPCTPTQTFWSVEYVSAIKTVRFGTYGRGIWDFQLETNTPTTEPGLAQGQFKIYPNPSTGPVTIETEGIDKDFHLIIRNNAGQILRQHSYQAVNNLIELNLNDFPPGIYYFTFQSADGLLTEKIVLSY